MTIVTVTATTTPTVFSVEPLESVIMSIERVAKYNNIINMELPVLSKEHEYDQLYLMKYIIIIILYTSFIISCDSYNSGTSDCCDIVTILINIF